MFDVAQAIREHFARQRVTMLGAGPMSKTVVDVVVEEANRRRKFIALIPSRRQVDSASAGGGYVEGWDASQFAQYVRSRDVGQFILLSRDHAGPWQDASDASHGQSDTRNELARAVDAIREDIDAGFHLIHIDPSIALEKGHDEADVEDMVVEILANTVPKGSQAGSVAFEVGTDEQSSTPEPPAITRQRLTSLLDRLRLSGLPRPLFYVAQTGTKVQDLRNTGAFDQYVDLKSTLPSSVLLPAIVGLCNANGVLLKEHNADYLSDRALSWHRRFGIHAANVAPEFGVAETRALISVLQRLEMAEEMQLFRNLVIAGGRWRKWLVPDREYPDQELVQIAGHYHFADPLVKQIRESALETSLRRGWNSEEAIAGEVRSSVSRYLDAFGYPGVRDA